MTIHLHDLALTGDVRPSPFCWHVRFALEHKGLDYITVPTSFAGIPRIAGGGHTTVPVIEDRSPGSDARAVGDSWAIAEYLEAAYPKRPSLFEGARGLAYARFMRNWLISAVRLPALKIILLDIYNAVQPEEQAYFRTSREQRFGMRLEDFTAGSRAEKIAALRAALEPLRATVKEQPFLSGAAPFYPDYLVAGYFLWWRAVSPARLLESDDPLTLWFDRLRAVYPRITAR